jgi:hypothetical protein
MAGLQMPILALSSTAAPTRTTERKAGKILNAHRRVVRIFRIVLFRVAITAEQDAFFKFSLHTYTIANGVMHLHADIEGLGLIVAVMKIHCCEITCVTATTARAPEKRNRPCLYGAMIETPAFIQTSLAVRVAPFVEALARFLRKSKCLGRKHTLATETSHQRCGIEFGATNMWAAFTKGRALQAVAARVHLTPSPVDHDARRNLFTALLTRMRRDDPFAWLRMRFPPASTVFTRVLPTGVWIFERHWSQVSTDGLTSQPLDGQAIALGVHPTHDRKTVGKAVSSLRLVR